MSAPSELHEARVAVLKALAHLAGCSARVVFDRALTPDVCLLDARRLRLFVGDAKAVETPGNDETRMRLRRYSVAAGTWHRLGFTVTFAVCHGRAHEALRWCGTVAEALRRAGMPTLTVSVTTLEPNVIVSECTVKQREAMPALLGSTYVSQTADAALVG